MPKKIKEAPEVKAARMKMQGERLAESSRKRAADRLLQREQTVSDTTKLEEYPLGEEGIEGYNLHNLLKDVPSPDDPIYYNDEKYQQLSTPLYEISSFGGKNIRIVESEMPTIPKEQEPTKQNHMSASVLEEPLVHNENEIALPELKEIKGIITIKPYISGEPNMGLEREDQPGGAVVVVPGIYQRDHIGCKAKGEYKTYFTGLDEMAPEVQQLPDEKRIAKITTIRQVVAYLENTVANNFKVKVGTCMDHYGKRGDDFWENVTTFRSSGPDKYDNKGNRARTYWDDVEVELDNDDKALNKMDPHDLVIYYAIQAGGLSMIAPSLQVAIESRGAYRWYLDQPEETADIRTEQKILRNQAGGYLEAMRTNDEARMFYMAKSLMTGRSIIYRRGGPNYTPIKKIYEDLSEYIDGRAGENSIVAVSRFLAMYKTPIDELCRRAVVKDCTDLHLIELKGDGRLYYHSEPLGRTIEDIVEYLLNPLNEATWVTLSNLAEVSWTE